MGFAELQPGVLQSQMQVALTWSTCSVSLCVLRGLLPTELMTRPVSTKDTGMTAPAP